jgi:hypothetical protein
MKMGYYNVKSVINFELYCIERHSFLLPSKKSLYGMTEADLSIERQPLLQDLDAIQKQVKQEGTYAEGTLASGVLLVALVTPILIALLAIFAPILSLPTALILLVLLTTAIVGGSCTLAIGVERLREGKSFLERITNVRKKLNNLRPHSTPPPLTPEQEERIRRVREQWNREDASRGLAEDAIAGT